MLAQRRLAYPLHRRERLMYHRHGAAGLMASRRFRSLRQRVAHCLIPRTPMRAVLFQEQSPVQDAEGGHADVRWCLRDAHHKCREFECPDDSKWRARMGMLAHLHI